MGEKIFSFHGKEANKFIHCKSIRDKLKKFLSIKDENIQGSTTHRVSSDTTNLLITDILKNIYFKFSNIKILGDSCIQEILDNTNINENIKDKKNKLSAKLKIIKSIKKVSGASTDILQNLHKIKLKYFNQRFNDFLHALNNPETLAQSVIELLNPRTQVQESINNKENNLENIKKYLRTSILSKKASDNFRGKTIIYDYSDPSSKILLKCVICHQTTLFDNNDNKFVSIIDFSDIYDISQGDINVQIQVDNLKKKQDKIEKLLIKLF